MAPSNLNQVFVMNSAVVSNATQFDCHTGTTPYNVLAASANKGGIWIRPLASGTQAYAAAALFSASTGAVAAAGQTSDWFQVVQGTTKAQPIATPLISPREVKRIKASVGAATVLHAQAATMTAVPAAVAGVNGSWMVKMDIRVAPTFYEMFANPSASNLDLTTSAVGGLGKIFPLLGNFSAGRTMIPICEIPAGTSAANAALLVYNAILNNATLNALVSFTAAQYATTTVTLTARHPGVIFDIAIFDTVSKTTTGCPAITTTGFNAGVGNYWQVISDEKTQRARYGYFNRMYFPFEQTNYAQVGTLYDCIEVSYEHNWPSSTGIARAGELNNFKIYCPAGVTTASSYGALLTGGVIAVEGNF
jgi:hypothetical protein